MDSEAEEEVEVSIGYWFPKSESHPFPQLYDSVLPGKVYEISGTYCIKKGQATVMVFFLQSKLIVFR